MEIEVNGVKYRLKEEKKEKSFYTSKTMLMLQALTIMSGSYLDTSKKSSSEKVGDENIIKEFGLIQQKKSNLSKSERDYVVWKFNKLFERIDE